MKNLAKIVGSGLLLVSASAVQADQQILDDLIVDGSACIGQDCVNGESFGFDTIRVKENNLRIKAQDTSTSASFPTNDWQLTFNDSANGGANKFSVDDVSGGRTPFTIEAGAPSHSLYVDDGGRVGFGTSTPVADLHVKSGNTPTLRLEQDGTSGFGAQTWDLAGNEANFFLRDASNGSTLPFRVFPGAPSNAITIEASTGDVGMGTTSPDDELDIESSEATTDLRLTNTSGTGANWRLRSNGVTGQFVIQDVTSTDSPVKIAGGAGNNRIFVDATGAVGINTNTPDAGAALDVNGAIFQRGASLHADYVFAPEYKLMTIEENAEFMWDQQHLPAVPKRRVDEAGLEIIEIGSHRQGMLEELEKAHIYIAQLHQGLRDKDSKLDALTDRLQRLEAQFNASQD